MGFNPWFTNVFKKMPAAFIPPSTMPLENPVISDAAKRSEESFSLSKLTLKLETNSGGCVVLRVLERGERQNSDFGINVAGVSYKQYKGASC